MYKYLNVCLIGNGIQSKRIQSILKKKKIKFSIFCPLKKNFSENNKKFLKSFNVVFIVSPNSTHFEYIKLLYKNSYIFCEKPPVNKISHLKKLRRINSNKIFYNFNFRFSKLAEMLKKKDELNFGKLKYINIVSGHALALKKDYKFNWRSKKKYCSKGILEMVSIHWIDLINFFFEIRKSYRPSLANLSKNGTSYDNCNIRIKLKNNAYADIFNSYTTPLVKKKLFIFQNGIIEQDNKYLKVSGPALNLNKNNFTREPKNIFKFKINENKDKLYSLNKSIDYFFSKIKNNSYFSQRETNISLKTSEYLLK